MATSKPFFKGQDEITCYAAGAITGATFVKPSSTQADGNFGVVTCGAALRAIGVATTDAASTAVVNVAVGPGMITEVTAAATLTAGQEVESNASGQAVVLASGKALGVVMADTASGALAPIKLSL